ncbi:MULTISPECIES: serine protease [unclassified Bradyrhizobium]|uniref:trypsin-like serine peptidase n=1 Tax=unclassified Bradyrhizobium TaxID=2631580 RepID=UPI001FFBAFA4|nr:MULTISPECIES: serine protease [unclassified Bradyrhizobium]MCK1668885.1 trypsin-like peptidase domain-containing protein [Bradyrhizobium sp. 153]MCK1755773.1 trypsin-like peptidase domain-containing protein [Bradyrhizobium sp. 137]
MCKRLVVSAFLSVTVCNTVFATPCETQATIATEFGRFIPWQRIIKVGESKRLESDDQLRYVRIHLRSIASSDDAWSLTIRDLAGRPLQTFSSKHLKPGLSQWTDRFAANSVTLDVVGAVSQVPVIETLQYVAVPKDAKRPYYSKQDAVPAWHDLHCCNTPADRRRVGESVGMLIATEGNSIDGVSLWTCSGFVVASDPHVLFVTNHHCGGTVGDTADRWSKEVCNNASVDFSWDGDAVGREYKCKEVEVQAPNDDLVILRLEATRAEAPPPPLALRSTRAGDVPVRIIHHPAAEAKKVSSNLCQALSTSVGQVATVKASRDFAHRCDTEAGSSGAPVLDADNVVVGVHHTGFEKTDPQSCDMLNKAVHTDRLVAILKANPQLTGYKPLP